ncbi:unnamed protein product [Wuchereria bancrofti]|uniref:Uncharacterized protein n=1 Tax=Wuchereria bancrofti TaxID=6293 RepID=A0A3P7DTK2_WUCBA|nr:unnamed protein product [Wuchereria bancrofti]
MPCKSLSAYFMYARNFVNISERRGKRERGGNRQLASHRAVYKTSHNVIDCLFTISYSFIISDAAVKILDSLKTQNHSIILIWKNAKHIGVIDCLNNNQSFGWGYSYYGGQSQDFGE